MPSATGKNDQQKLISKKTSSKQPELLKDLQRSDQKATKIGLVLVQPPFASFFAHQLKPPQLPFSTASPSEGPCRPLAAIAGGGFRVQSSRLWFLDVFLGQQNGFFLKNWKLGGKVLLEAFCSVGDILFGLILSGDSLCAVDKEDATVCQNTHPPSNDPPSMGKVSKKFRILR